jgi:hypothetical protein
MLIHKNIHTHARIYWVLPSKEQTLFAHTNTYTLVRKLHSKMCVCVKIVFAVLIETGNTHTKQQGHTNALLLFKSFNKYINGLEGTYGYCDLLR